VARSREIHGLAILILDVARLQRDEIGCRYNVLVAHVLGVVLEILGHLLETLELFEHVKKVQDAVDLRSKGSVSDFWT
jgi:hypothetical protein